MDKGTNIALGVLFGITLVSGIILSGSYVSAEDVIDNVAITVESSCSMSGNINTAHTANLKNSTYSGAEGSTYENGIGKTTLTTFCNDMNGFSIYAIGFTGDVAGNTNLVGANNGSFIPTGTAISGDTSNWAMKVTKVDNPGGQQPDVTYNPQNMTITNSFNNFHAVPDTYTKVAEYHAETGSSATDQGPGALGAKIETTYATYVSADQYADTYTGQVKYVMVHPYNTAAPITPPAPAATCNTPVPGITYMQEINSTNRTAVLASLTEESPYFLRDSRDEQPYCVSKLKDGNLWMLDDLALDLTNPTILNIMNESNTNASNTTLGYLRGANARDPNIDASGNYATAGVTNWTSSYSYSVPLVSLSDKNTVTINDALSEDAKTWRYGGYYNYCAASAGSYCYGNGIDSSRSVGNATESICPANWRMPTGGSSGELKALYDNPSYNSYSDYRSVLHLPLSGSFYKGSASAQGSYGHLWSSTSFSDGKEMYGLLINTSEVNPTNYGYRTYGRSLRCILDN